jgi:hypothetical protein
MANKKVKAEYTKTDLEAVANAVFSLLADDPGVQFTKQITKRIKKSAVDNVEDSHDLLDD